MEVSFPIKFRLLGNGQKVVTSDPENLSALLRKERKKACTLFSISPWGAILSVTVYSLHCGHGSDSVTGQL